MPLRWNTGLVKSWDSAYAAFDDAPYNRFLPISQWRRRTLRSAPLPIADAQRHLYLLHQQKIGARFETITHSNSRPVGCQPSATVVIHMGDPSSRFSGIHFEANASASRWASFPYVRLAFDGEVDDKALPASWRIVAQRRGKLA